MESQINYLIEIIHKLSDKIDNLENKIDNLEENYHKSSHSSSRQFPIQIPSLSFESWIETWVVSEKVLHIACSVSILEGVKQCILENFQKQKGKEKDKDKFDTIPLCVSMRPKQLHIYHTSWEAFNDDHLNHFIQELWRKFLELFLQQSSYDSDRWSEEIDHNDAEDNYRDICMKKLLEMRKTLVLRHRKELLRYLITETKNFVI